MHNKKNSCLSDKFYVFQLQINKVPIFYFYLHTQMLLLYYLILLLTNIKLITKNLVGE